MLEVDERKIRDIGGKFSLFSVFKPQPPPPYISFKEGAEPIRDALG